MVNNARLIDRTRHYTPIILEKTEGAPTTMPSPKEISRELQSAGKFIKFETIKWQDKDGTLHQWEVAERIIGLETVMIIPWIEETQELIIIKQYRPPARDYVYEFPAGLVDKGEDHHTAAKRELFEETGYRGEIKNIIAPTYNTPGLSGETVFNVYMSIPAEQIPTPCPEGTEDIEVVLLQNDSITDFLNSELTSGSKFDTKLLTYLYGIETAKKIQTEPNNFIQDLPPTSQ